MDPPTPLSHPHTPLWLSLHLPTIAIIDSQTFHHLDSRLLHTLIPHRLFLHLPATQLLLQASGCLFRAACIRDKGLVSGRLQAWHFGRSCWRGGMDRTRVLKKRGALVGWKVNRVVAADSGTGTSSAAATRDRACHVHHFRSGAIGLFWGTNIRRAGWIVTCKLSFQIQPEQI